MHLRPFWKKKKHEIIWFATKNEIKTHYHNIFSNKNKGTYGSRRQNAPFTNEDMISDVKRKKCDTKKNSAQNFTKSNSKTHPLLNCLNGGLITAPFPTTEYLPVRTAAKSPRIIAPLWTITFPCKTIFCEPHNTVCRLTLLPDAYKNFVWNNFFKL